LARDVEEQQSTREVQQEIDDVIADDVQPPSA
jgi:hypothetical protein